MSACFKVYKNMYNKEFKSNINFYVEKTFKSLINITCINVNLYKRYTYI